MIVHAYLTDGMYEWAVLFLESFKKHHGTSVPIVLSTRDLNQEEQARLREIYDGIDIRNEMIDYEKLAGRTNRTVDELRTMKFNTEHGNFDLLWKQFISVEDRYRRSIVEVMDDYMNKAHSHLLHIDIDMYFRGNIAELFELIEKNDISIYFRPKEDKKYKNENRRVLGSIIGFKLDDRVRKFMDVWKEHIDSIPLSEKPIGFGQTSFYRAFLDTKSDYRWGNIPLKFSDPGQSPDALIWAGNRGEKDNNLRQFKIDFQEGGQMTEKENESGTRKKIRENFNKILAKKKGGAFLEVGIGPKVKLRRHKKLKNYNISYVGLDFEDVCKLHQETLGENGFLDSRVELLPNRVGTYLFNLVRLKREGRKFDIVYLDGHHTLYVDMAAAFAVLPLLKPGSLFIFDDVQFTLHRKEMDLKNSEFYKTIYDFSLYEDDEKREAHIGIILNEYILPMFNFEKVEEFSEPNWVVLRVPGKGVASTVSKLKKLFQ